MNQIATESFQTKNRLVEELAYKYGYQPWQVRIFDMQRASLQLDNPLQMLVPNKMYLSYVTLTLQANGFTFTTSENSPTGHRNQQIISPYRIEAQSSENNRVNLCLSYDHQPVKDFQSLYLLNIMGRPSIYYFPYKDRLCGKSLHTYLVLNPYENCAYRCQYCSRLPYFKLKSPEYSENIQRAIRDVLIQVDSPKDVRYISIITGSLESADADLALMQAVQMAFDQAGFEHCEFGYYTSNIHTPEQLALLRRMRVAFFTVTLEVTSNDARKRLHGHHNPKRFFDFWDTLHLIQQAETIFPYVNITLMLGYEPAHTLKNNLEILGNKTSATINHYIPRIWLHRQYELLDPSAGKLEYYIDLCAFIEQSINKGRKTIGAFFDERFGIPQFKMRYRS